MRSIDIHPIFIIYGINIPKPQISMVTPNHNHSLLIRWKEAQRKYSTWRKPCNLSWSQSQWIHSIQIIITTITNMAIFRNTQNSFNKFTIIQATTINKHITHFYGPRFKNDWLLNFRGFSWDFFRCHSTTTQWSPNNMTSSICWFLGKITERLKNNRPRLFGNLGMLISNCIKIRSVCLVCVVRWRKTNLFWRLERALRWVIVVLMLRAASLSAFRLMFASLCCSYSLTFWDSMTFDNTMKVGFYQRFKVHKNQWNSIAVFKKTKKRNHSTTTLFSCS